MRLLILLAALCPVFAGASVEVRGSYRLLQTAPESLNGATSPYPSLKLLGAWAMDVLFYLPSMPVGVGGRYETFSATDQNSTGESDTKWTRVSVLVNSRLIDDPSYFAGPIGSIAVSNNYRTLLTPRTASVPVEYKASGNLSASGGFEVGYKLLWFNIGAEVGYLYAPLGNLQDTLGQTLNLPVGHGPASVDFSGWYGSVSFGAAF